jgi:hypothetical protein
MNVQLRVCTGLVALVVAIAATDAFGAAINVATVGSYAASPTAGMTINDATSNSAATGITLANFKPLLTAAFAGNTGGDIDAEDQTAGGTINPTYWRNNGTNYGNGAANQITATYGTSQGNALGIYRSDVDPANGAPFGINGATGNAFVASGTSYIGIQGAMPVNLVFTKGLSALGFTVVPRGAARTVTMTAVLTSGSIVGSSQSLTADNLSGAFFWGFKAPAGTSIVGLTVTSPEGLSRFDDLGFVVAPEPASMTLIGLGSLGLVMMRRRCR